MEATWTQTDKQTLAWQYLTDKVTSELLFGGGAGGGKTRLGCSWGIYLSLQYPGLRGLIGRAKLKSLKETTLATFFDVCREWGLRQDIDYRYNSIEGIIYFPNGSTILLKDLFAYPSDPNFDSLGSLEISWAFIDEANQCKYKAIETVRSRIRYKLDLYNLTPKLLMTCNPSKGWPYTEFYKPSKKGTLPSHRKFIQALAKDNQFISKSYVDNLKSLKIMAIKQRLLSGNWEYDDDPGTLFEYDAIEDIFTTKWKPKEGEKAEKWITADVSRKGIDKFPIFYWEGWQVKEIVVLPPELRQDSKRASDWLISYADKKGVRRSHIIVDEDGVGGGVVDNTQCTGFINGSKAVQPKEAEDDPTKKVNYANLKSQCYDLLSVRVADGEIGIDDPNDPDLKAMIIEELEMIKQVDVDSDKSFRIISKEEIKEALGRSPDFADSIMMRVYGDLKPRVYEPGFREI